MASEFVLRADILVVEDEAAQRDVLAYNLEAAGYRVRLAKNGSEALEAVRDETPDLVVLDWMLPEVSGIDVCRRLKRGKQTKAVPIIMLSARGEGTDRIQGLETGADDYVVKPYLIAELLVRVRNHLRRATPARAGEILTHGDIELDSTDFRVRRGKHEVTLSPVEFRLLATFMEQPGRVWSRDQLLNRVWGVEVMLNTRTVDVHVGRLRRALCQFGGKNPVRTVRSAGYALQK